MKDKDMTHKPEKPTWLISLIVIGAYILEDKFGWSLYRHVSEPLEGWPRLIASAFLFLSLIHI